MLPLTLLYRKNIAKTTTAEVFQSQAVENINVFAMIEKVRWHEDKGA